MALGTLPQVGINAVLTPLGNLAAPLGPLLCGGSVNFPAGSTLIRPLNLAKDTGPALHLAYGQSISSPPLIETIDYLNLKLLLDSITSNCGASILIRSSFLRCKGHGGLLEG